MQTLRGHKLLGGIHMWITTEQALWKHKYPPNIVYHSKTTKQESAVAETVVRIVLLLTDTWCWMAVCEILIHKGEAGVN